jgi:hypothetical protein
MSQENDSQAKARKPFRRRTILIAVSVALLVSLVCFILVAVLPRPKGPFVEAPLRSFLTGLGLLGVACPPLIVGALLKKRAQASPYFEEGFIRAGFNLFGLVCLVLGLTCTGLSIYALIKRLLGTG